jgi:hypothetical protein
MRLTVTAQIHPLLPLSLLTLSLSHSIAAVAQDPAPCGGSEPNCENSRFFQMTLLTYPAKTGIRWVHTAPYEDIGTFTSDNTDFQPPGRSIMLHEQWQDIDVSELAVDWSRILAVNFDEPFANIVPSFPSQGPPPTGGYCETVRASIVERKARLLSQAEAVHTLAPRARVWVTYLEKEVDWMRSATCPVALNDSTFDVVGLDKYEVNFSNIEDEYAWFASAWPQQQVALVPATAYKLGGPGPQATADIMQGYFDYANNMNQPCDMPPGRVGRTGVYDRCRVWVVAGWLSEPWYPLDGNWVGLLNTSPPAPGVPAAAPMRERWATELAKRRRVSGSRALSDAEISVVLDILE